jgi:hypothetical protein
LALCLLFEIFVLFRIFSALEMSHTRFTASLVDLGPVTTTTTPRASPPSRLEHKTSFLSSHAAFNNGVLDDDCVVVATVENNDVSETEDILISPLQRTLARFFIVTAAMPLILTIWASWIQSKTLYGHASNSTLPFGKLVLAFASIAVEVFLSSTHPWL